MHAASSRGHRPSIISGAPQRYSVDDIANHGLLYQSVPHTAIFVFQNHCSHHFLSYMRANQEQNDSAKVDALSHILRAPKHILTSSATSTRVAQQNSQSGNPAEESNSNREQKEEINLGVDQEEEKQPEEAEQTIGSGEILYPEDNQSDSSSSFSNPTSPADAKLCKKVANLIRAGHLTRASKMLCRPQHEVKPSLSTDELIRQLQPLHPKAEKDPSSVLLPADSETITIDIRDADTSKPFRKMIQQIANGASAGLSGWTGDMLKAIYPNSICREGLALLLTDICNGTLPEEAKQYILPSHLVPIAKPGTNSQSTNSIRPISMGEIFYRAAASYAVQRVTDAAAQILSPIQFGVGKGAGCEQAVHRLQHLLTRSHPIRLAGIAVDFKNAFNERSRADILHELFQHEELQSIWRIAHWAYSDPSGLWIQNEQHQLFWPKDELSSEEGVKQGDPLSSLLFALSMKRIYGAAVAADKTGSVAAIAFLDDCTLVGQANHQLFQAFDILRAKAKEGGLDVNISKTKALWLHTDTALPTLLHEEAAARNMKVELGATMLLGAPIGTDKEKMQALVMNAVGEQQRFFDLILSQYLPAQEALTMLRLCTIPRLNYLSRTTHPSILEPAAQRFDRMMYTTAIRKLNLPLPLELARSIDARKNRPIINNSSNNDSIIAENRRAFKQMQLPIRLSGLGLRSAEETMNFAYLSSLVRVAYEGLDWWREEGPNELNNVSFHLQLEEVLDNAQKQLPKEYHQNYIPKSTDIAEFVEQTLTKSKKPASNDRREKQKQKLGDRVPSLLRLQAELGAAYAQANLKKLKAQAKEKTNGSTDLQRLDRLSKDGAESHMWLQVVASDPTLRMPDVAVRHAACYRLGLNPYPNLPPTCLCGKAQPYHSNCFHALSCPIVRNRGTNVRHHLITKNLTSWLRRAGLNVEREVEGMGSEDNKRPDVVFWHKYKQHIIDVTVTDPFNQTNSRRAGSNSHKSMTSSTHDSNSNITNERNNSSSSYRAADYDTITATIERRKNRHYQKMVEENYAVFHTAAACTTGSLGKEFRQLIELISSIAQEDRGGWDPAEVMAGIRGSIAVAIQVGNAVVLEQSWKAVTVRDTRQLTNPGDTRRRTSSSVSTVRNQERS